MVESGFLLRSCTVKSCTVGSNPTLSESILLQLLFTYSALLELRPAEAAAGHGALAADPIRSESSWPAISEDLTKAIWVYPVIS